MSDTDNKQGINEIREDTQGNVTCRMDLSPAGIDDTLKSFEKDGVELSPVINNNRGFFKTVMLAMAQAIKSVYISFPKAVVAGTGIAVFETLNLLTKEFILKKYNKKDLEDPDSALYAISNFFKGVFKSASSDIFKPIGTVGSGLYDFTYNKVQGELTVAQVPYSSFAPVGAQHVGNSPAAARAA